MLEVLLGGLDLREEAAAEALGMKDGRGRTALNFAAKKGDLRAAKALVEKVETFYKLRGNLMSVKNIVLTGSGRGRSFFRPGLLGRGRAGGGAGEVP